MNEREFSKLIAEVAHLHGWTVAHFAPAKTEKGWRTPVREDAKGFPDLVLVRDRVVYAELKVPGNSLTPEQRFWLDTLRDAGQEVYCWWPRDYDSGEILDVLRAGDPRFHRLLEASRGDAQHARRVQARVER